MWVLMMAVLAFQLFVVVYDGCVEMMALKGLWNQGFALVDYIGAMSQKEQVIKLLKDFYSRQSHVVFFEDLPVEDKDCIM